jgi:hypothetical protein
MNGPWISALLQSGLPYDESDYVHGTMLFVDGCMTLYPGFAAGG